MSNKNPEFFLNKNIYTCEWNKNDYPVISSGIVTKITGEILKFDKMSVHINDIYLNKEEAINAGLAMIRKIRKDFLNSVKDLIPSEENEMRLYAAYGPDRKNICFCKFIINYSTELGFKPTYGKFQKCEPNGDQVEIVLNHLFEKKPTRKEFIKTCKSGQNYKLFPQE